MAGAHLFSGVRLASCPAGWRATWGARKDFGGPKISVSNVERHPITKLNSILLLLLPLAASFTVSALLALLPFITMALKRTTREPSAFDEFMEIFSSPTTEQKEKDSKVLHPFANVDKTVVIQESRIFHDSKLVKEQPHTCCRILAQLIRIKDLNKQPFTEVEATEMFFSSTKLFVSDDASLRRMLYLFIKEFYVLCDFNNVIIVTSSLTKDMTCDIDLYRANALRVLSRIIDSAMLGAIERYVKQAIVDRSHAVASGALVSAIHLYERCPENAVIVRRWISETQEAVKSPNPMVQFHGIQLLYQIKSHDRLGVSKLVSQYTKQRGVKSPMAIVLLIRYTAKLMRDEITSGRSSGVSINDSGSNTCQEGYQFLEKCLRHPSEMVMYEAARDICSLPAMEAEDLNPAVNVLQGFLGSGKPTIRYVSMKTLSKVAEKHPRIVSKCNQEFEQLIYDKNHLVSTIAVTTLLKTGSEETIGSLLEPISKFMDSMDDDNRVSVVRSLYRLCIKYPAKHVLLIGFMSRFLRDRGGFEFKRAIVQSIVSLIRAMPEIAESALLQLCEYIEDCEYLQLATEIIHTLGEMGPSLPAKAEFIPYIYNRMILEQHEIRSAGVLSLFKFAAQCPSLRSSILPLINRA
jgi:coatomer protein complex subunit gamma